MGGTNRTEKHPVLLHIKVLYERRRVGRSREGIREGQREGYKERIERHTRLRGWGGREKKG